MLLNLVKISYNLVKVTSELTGLICERQMLGKPADWAMHFTFRNFFFFYYEQSYLSIHWTDFHDLFTKWKAFA